MTDSFVERFANASTLEWIPRPVEVGTNVPANPPEDIQMKFVGQSYLDAYEVAHTFVTEVEKYARKHGLSSLRDLERVVDFGSGWGRITRMLLAKGVEPTNMYPIDVDPEMTALLGVTMPGMNAMTVSPLPPTVIANSAIELGVAFSVFSHLAPIAHEAWATEFGRITKPGGIVAVTILEDNFFGQVQAAKDAVADGTGSSFHESLAATFEDVNAARRGFANGEAQYAGVGGAARSDDLYGWTACPRSYVDRVWEAAGFEVLEWVPTNVLFEQALVILRKRTAAASAARKVQRVSRRGKQQIMKSLPDPIADGLRSMRSRVGR